MPRSQQILTNFASGEITPRMHGRLDTQQYLTGMDKCINWFIDTHGGIDRRHGLRYVRPIKFEQQGARLIPFALSSGESYVLEFGHYYIRFFTDKGYVTNPGRIRVYIGDGTTAKFFYPYDSGTVAPGDIEVYVNDFQTQLALGTDYTITDSPAGTNILPSFGDAAWVNPSTETPETPGNVFVAFTLGVGNAYYESTLARAANQINAMHAPVVFAAGMDLQSSITISEVEYDKTAQSDNVALVGLSQDSRQIVLTATIDRDPGTVEDTTVDMQLNVDETQGGGRTFDLDWEILQNSVVIQSGTEFGVTSAGATINVNGLVLSNPAFNDIIQVAVTPKNYVGVNTGAILNLGQLDVTYNAYPDPQVQLIMWDGNDDEVSDTFRPVVGTRVGDGIQNVAPKTPLNYGVAVDAGVRVRFTALELNTMTNGQVINMDLGSAPYGPPGDGATIAIREDPTNPGAPDSTEPFEIQSPYPYPDVFELYYAQANDIMYIAHPEFAPRKLLHFGPYDWRVENAVLTGAPWEDGGYDPVTQGYPAVVTFFQQRLYWGNTFQSPQTLWGSWVNDFENHTPDTADPPDPAGPLVLEIAAYSQEAIEWLSSDTVLLIGTTATEHRFKPDSYVATNNLPDLARMTTLGGRHIIPVYIGGLTCFVQATGREIRAIEQRGGTAKEIYDALDLMWLAEHLVPADSGGILAMTFALVPNSQLFTVLQNGNMNVLTYDPNVAGDFQGIGWSRVVTDGAFESVTSIPVDAEDETWVVVRRLVDGSMRRYVEFFEKDHMTDASLTYGIESVQPPIQTVSGLDHLNGKTLNVITNESLHPPVTVSNGEITLNYPSDRIEAGLPYLADGLTLDWAQGNPAGSGAGMAKRWVRVFARLYDSAFPLINGDRPRVRDPATPMTTGEPLFTGDVEVRNLNIAKQGGKISIQQDLPFQTRITALFGDFEVNSG